MGRLALVGVIGGGSEERLVGPEVWPVWVSTVGGHRR